MLSSDLFWFMEYVFLRVFWAKIFSKLWAFSGPQKANGPSNDREVGICFSLNSRHFLDGFASLFAGIAAFFTEVLVFAGSWVLPPIVALNA